MNAERLVTHCPIPLIYHTSYFLLHPKSYQEYHLKSIFSCLPQLSCQNSTEWVELLGFFCLSSLQGAKAHPPDSALKRLHCQRSF